MPNTENSSLVVYVFVFTALLLFVRRFFSPHNLRDIPTVGGPSAPVPVLSYIRSYKYVYNACTLLQEGYNKYKGGMFKIPMVDRWLVVLTGPKQIDELQRLSDEHVSFLEASAELSGIKYMFRLKIWENPYHIAIICQQLTRHLITIFPDVYDEIVAVFDDFVPARTDGWISIPVLSTLRQIVARTSNRVFLGLPHCRNAAWLELVNDATIAVGKGHLLIGLFLPILKLFAVKVIAKMDRHVETCTQFIRKLIDDRLRHMEKFGDNWNEKPNDMIQWLIDKELKCGEVDIKNISNMLLLLNFAAVHTSSNSFTHALYYLAANPEFVTPLREEIERVIQEEGWMKVAMGKMRKLDSFMFSMKQRLLQDVKLSDGTFLPVGTVIIAMATAIHTDEENYTNSDVFDPWHFCNIREEDGEGFVV